jgi:hypothetical protein
MARELVEACEMAKGWKGDRPILRCALVCLAFANFGKAIALL